MAQPQPWHCQMFLLVLILSLDACHQQQSIGRTEGPVIGQTFHLRRQYMGEVLSLQKSGNLSPHELNIQLKLIK